MTIALLSLSSCRQDLLPEKETYHNTSAFQLTSKRISLNEAKNKAKLLPELKKAEAEFKAFSKTNAQGKVVNYGNGVSIDTDDVIYIEKGSDFHSYTFHIKHENAPVDAPVENLVLTVQEDGTYSELLLSYNFTQQEKQNLMIGIPVNAKGKVTITELAQGTYNNGGLLGKQVCVLVEKTMWNACSSGAHDGTNANQCEFINNMENGTPPTAYVVVTRQCTAQPVDYGLGENGENGGSGPQNGPGGLSNNPPEETTTAPNLPTPTRNSDPCIKIKAQRTYSDFNSKITDLQGKTGLKKETGYIQRTNGEYTYNDNASATNEANELGLPNPELQENKNIIAYFHTHVNDFSYDDPENPVVTITKKGFKIFSPADMVYFMDMIKNAQDAGRSLGDVYAIMVSSLKNYQIRFTGDQSQIKTFTNAQSSAFKNPYIKFMLDNESQSLEFKFLKFIDEKMNLKGISLYRMNSDGTTTEIKLNADKTDTTETNCPL